VYAIDKFDYMYIIQLFSKSTISQGVFVCVETFEQQNFKKDNLVQRIFKSWIMLNSAPDVLVKYIKNRNKI
jgi:hypothetical protein